MRIGARVRHRFGLSDGTVVATTERGTRWLVRWDDEEHSSYPLAGWDWSLILLP